VGVQEVLAVARRVVEHRLTDCRYRHVRRGRTSAASARFPRKSEASERQRHRARKQYRFPDSHHGSLPSALRICARSPPWQAAFSLQLTSANVTTQPCSVKAMGATSVTALQ